MPLLTTSHDVLLVLVFSCQHLTLSRRAVTSPRASPDSLPSLYHFARKYSYSSNIASTTTPQHERSRGKNLPEDAELDRTRTTGIAGFSAVPISYEANCHDHSTIRETSKQPGRRRMPGEVEVRNQGVFIALVIMLGHCSAPRVTYHTTT
jgi:hypothetical protein